MAELIDLTGEILRPVLDWLLRDQTTKQHILFAAEDRADCGADYAPEAPMTAEKLLRENCPVSIRPRVEKTAGQRTRKKSVGIPSARMVNHINNLADCAWFGRDDVFNHEKIRSWVPNREPVAFPEDKSWQLYVDFRQLESCCGEASFIVSYYDSATGVLIPRKKRVGLLDRKLRVVNENAADDAEWLHWTERAFQSVYGYEFRGDSLLIARANLLLSFAEHYEARFSAVPESRLLRKYANIISWNFWQMDEQTGKVPYTEKNAQLSLFDFLKPQEEPASIPACRVMDWCRGHAVDYAETQQGEESAMKWGAIISSSVKEMLISVPAVCKNSTAGGGEAESGSAGAGEPGLF